MALPYHIFVISTQVPGMPLQIQFRLGAGAVSVCVIDESVGDHHPDACPPQQAVVI
jgi:hypothetical protein